MTSSGKRDTDLSVGARVKISRDVSGRNTDRSQEHQAKMREVLADATLCPPGLKRRRRHPSRADLIGHAGSDPRRDCLDSLDRVLLFAKSLCHLGELFIARRVRSRTQILD